MRLVLLLTFILFLNGCAGSPVKPIYQEPPAAIPTAVKELETLDPQAINIVNSLVDYMEKKYISVPMKMAKDIFLKETSK